MPQHPARSTHASPWAAARQLLAAFWFRVADAGTRPLWATSARFRSWKWQEVLESAHEMSGADCAQQYECSYSLGTISAGSLQPLVNRTKYSIRTLYSW